MARCRLTSWAERFLELKITGVLKAIVKLVVELGTDLRRDGEARNGEHRQQHEDEQHVVHRVLQARDENHDEKDQRLNRHNSIRHVRNDLNCLHYVWGVK